MNTEAEKIASILSYLDELKRIFDQRPRMLGTPYEVNSNFFYLDAIELLARGCSSDNFFEASWPEFLIQKKLIVGAKDILRENLRANDEDYSGLQALRREFFLWRKEKRGI
jgi:hypothetical protein